jgi:TPR repeat protein
MSAKIIKYCIALCLLCLCCSCIAWSSGHLEAYECVYEKEFDFVERQQYRQARELWTQDYDNGRNSLAIAAMDAWRLGGVSKSLEDLLPGMLGNERVITLPNSWERCIDNGSIGARLIAAIVYYNGFHGKADYGRAEALFREVAKHKHPVAFLGLGAIDHMRGMRVEANRSISQAIDYSDSLDEYIVGQLFLQGIIFKKDSKMAAYWYEKAAHKGSVKAQGMIGYMYAIGVGVEPDKEKSRYWLQLQKDNSDFVSDNERSIVVDPVLGD